MTLFVLKFEKNQKTNWHQISTQDVNKHTHTLTPFKNEVELLENF